MTVGPENMAPPRSNIWKRFQKVTPNTAKCNLCVKVLKTSGNTTNLKTHLKQKHSSILQHLTEEKKETDEPKKKKRPSQHESRMDVKTPGTSSSLHQDEKKLIASQEIDDDDHHSSTSTMTVSEYDVEPSTSTEKSSSLYKQATIVSIFKTISSFKDGGSKNVKLTEALIKFIVQDNLPFNIVEGKGFLSLMKQVAPLYKVPTRNTIKNNVDRKFEVISTAFKNILKKSKYFTITTDIWTADMQTKSFMGITVHFVHDMKLTSATIGIVELSESHTADYIALELGKALQIWGIDPNDVVAVVTDNAANMVKAMHDKFGKNRHIPCFAHTLNLVCENSLTNTEGLSIIIDKIRSIVVWFKRSVKASDQLRKIQIDAGTIEGNIKKMILDVKTRWNSTYYMIERFLLMSSMVSNILFSDVNAPNMITAAEVEHLREICKLLKPLERMTVEISGENYPTISKVIPMIGCLINQYNNYSPQYEVGKHLKTTLLKEIEKRFGAIEKSYIPAVSTILDSRFKQINFRDPQAPGTVM